MAKTAKKEKVQAIRVETPIVERVAPKIGRIGSSKIWNREEAAAYRQQVVDLGKFLWAEHYARLGEAMGDDNATELQGEGKFVAAESDIVKTVMETEEGRLRELLVQACGQAMIKHFPKSIAGYRHIANHGVDIGLLRRLRKGEKGFSANLPFGSRGQWEFAELVSDIPGGSEIITELRKVGDGLLEKYQSSQRQEKERRRQLVEAQLQISKQKAENISGFLEAVETGRGRAVFCIKAFGDNPECVVEILMDNEKIVVTNVTGLGDMAKSLKGLNLPASAFDGNRVNFSVTARMSYDNRRRADYFLVGFQKAVTAAREKKAQPGLPKPEPIAAPAPEPEK